MSSRVLSQCMRQVLRTARVPRLPPGAHSASPLTTLCVRSFSSDSSKFAAEPLVNDQPDSTEEVTAEDASATEGSTEYHTIISSNEKVTGAGEKQAFQAETRKLLDIVAHSLYSNKEVFVRELVSNASDALEKLRHLQLTGKVSPDLPLEIHVATDAEAKTFTLQDTGLGMSKEELISNLGTIAKSGTEEFAKQVAESGGKASEVIGRFGVGFYSSFMVAQNVEVFTRSHLTDQGHKWVSDGSGNYELFDAEGVAAGTKIVLHLKDGDENFAKEEAVKEIIQKYSNFIGVPIFLNGKRVNVVQPIWTLQPNEVSEDLHHAFYQYVSGFYDSPQYTYHFTTDVPIGLKALFYIPETKPNPFEMSRDTDCNVALYSRKVLILPKADACVPKWLRFVRGVIDSEDMPLNLSRELLQDSALVRRIRELVTAKLIRFLQTQQKRDPAKYAAFYIDYGVFLREGIVTTPDQTEREDIAKLLKFESSSLPAGETTTLAEYGSRMQAGERKIFFLSAPSRQLAESSPYYEAIKAQGCEVLFLTEPFDELVLMQLGQFDKKILTSIENEARGRGEDNVGVVSGLTAEESTDLMNWVKNTLGTKITEVKVTNKLENHPCVITCMEMGSARYFARTMLADKSQEDKLRLLQPALELNPNHAVVTRLNALRHADPSLAALLVKQLYETAMLTAGLIDDPRELTPTVTELVRRLVEKVDLPAAPSNANSETINAEDVKIVQ